MPGCGMACRAARYSVLRRRCSSSQASVVRSYLDEIDTVARRMLRLAAAPAVSVEETEETEADEEETDMVG